MINNYDFFILLERIKNIRDLHALHKNQTGELEEIINTIDKNSSNIDYINSVTIIKENLDKIVNNSKTSTDKLSDFYSNTIQIPTTQSLTNQEFKNIEEKIDELEDLIYPQSSQYMCYTNYANYNQYASQYSNYSNYSSCYGNYSGCYSSCYNSKYSNYNAKYSNYANYSQSGGTIGGL